MSGDVHIENEPPPPPRAGPRIAGGAHILIVDTKTGEVVNEVKTPHYTVNERRLREESKY